MDIKDQFPAQAFNLARDWQVREILTLDICRAFSMMDRNLTSDSTELATLPGASIFFSFNLETANGSKSSKTSLQEKWK